MKRSCQRWIPSTPKRNLPKFSSPFLCRLSIWFIKAELKYPVSRRRFLDSRSTAKSGISSRTHWSASTERLNFFRLMISWGRSPRIACRNMYFSWNLSPLGREGSMHTTPRIRNHEKAHGCPRNKYRCPIQMMNNLVMKPHLSSSSPMRRL